MPAVGPGPDTSAQLRALDALAELGAPDTSPDQPGSESPDQPGSETDQQRHDKPRGESPRDPGPSTTAQLRALDALIKLGTAIFPRRVSREQLPPAKISVVIPAHNEAGSIGQTLASLRKQTLQPQEVIVVCDNCTDDTERIATAEGARVFTSYRNTAKKAGALNQLLSLLLPAMEADELVLVMDADSALNDDWLSAASSVLQRLPDVGAVCGVYFGETGSGLIGAAAAQRVHQVRASGQQATAGPRAVGDRHLVPDISAPGNREGAREVATRPAGRVL